MYEVVILFRLRGYICRNRVGFVYLYLIIKARPTARAFNALYLGYAVTIVVLGTADYLPITVLAYADISATNEYQSPIALALEYLILDELDEKYLFGRNLVESRTIAKLLANLLYFHCNPQIV